MLVWAVNFCSLSHYNLQLTISFSKHFLSKVTYLSINTTQVYGSSQEKTTQVRAIKLSLSPMGHTCPEAMQKGNA